MTKRTIEELGDFLELPYTAVLATTWADGSVLLSPVWYEWRNGGFNIGVPEDDVKVRHIRRDPRVTVLVYEQSWPSRSLEVRGTATITREGRAGLTRRLSVRYLGEVNGNRYASGVAPGLVLRVEPGIVRAWDFSDEVRPEPATAVLLVPRVVSRPATTD